MSNWLMIASDAAGFAAAISTTRYQLVSGRLSSGGTEATNSTNVRESYTWSSLWCRVTANAATTNACTVRSRINASNGNMVISIAAGTTGTFAEASPSSDSLIADKLIDYSLANADATGTVTFTIISSILKGTNPVLVAFGGGGINQGSTNYVAIAGGGGTTSAEATIAYTFRTATTLSDMHVTCNANTVLAASTIYCRINSANGNLTVSIPALTTGVYDDAVNTDAVAVGQTVNSITTVGAGGTSINITSIAYRSTSVVMQLANQTANTATSSFGTTYFLILNGHPQRNNTTEANEQTLARMNFAARNLFVRFNSNGVNGTSTAITRKSGVNGNLTVSIPASTSGNYEDNTNSDVVASTNTYNFSVTLGGTSGTTYITACNVEQVGAQTYELSCTDGIKLDDTPSIYRIIDLSVSDGFKGSDTPAGGLLYQLLASDGLKLLAGQGRLIGSGNVSVDGYLSPNTFYLSKFTARFTNTGTQFKIYTKDAINAKVAIYADSTGEPGALLNALNAAQSLTAGWNTLDFPATSIIAGTAYWLGFNSG